MQSSLFLFSSFCSLLIWLGRAFLEMDFIFFGLEVIFRLGPPLASTTYLKERIKESVRWRDLTTLNYFLFKSDISITIPLLWTRLTWFQFFLVPTGSFFHRFTRSTQALQISPDLVSFNLQNNYSSFCVEEKIFHIHNTHYGCISHQTPRVRLWLYLLPKTAPEVFLIPLAVRETRAWWLCTADAASVQTPIHFRLMKAKHLCAKYNSNVNN